MSIKPCLMCGKITLFDFCADCYFGLGNNSLPLGFVLPPNWEIVLRESIPATMREPIQNEVIEWDVELDRGEILRNKQGNTPVAWARDRTARNFRSKRRAINYGPRSSSKGTVTFAGPVSGPETIRITSLDERILQPGGISPMESPSVGRATGTRLIPITSHSETSLSEPSENRSSEPSKQEHISGPSQTSTSQGLPLRKSWTKKEVKNAAREILSDTGRITVRDIWNYLAERSDNRRPTYREMDGWGEDGGDHLLGSQQGRVFFRDGRG